MNQVHMDNDKVVSVLNDLIATCKDGEEGFKQCSELLDRPELKTLFGRRSRECGDSARELQALSKQLGGVPTDSRSASGALHQAWLKVKTALSSNDEALALEECERSEDVALVRYREALEADLPLSARAVIERQNNGVIRNHDQVRALRDAAKNIC